MLECIKHYQYGSEIIPTARKKFQKFKKGLNYNIKGLILIFHTKNFNELVEAAKEAEQHQ